MITPSSKIYLKKSSIAGRGVFAKQPIKKNELIEVAPVIVVPDEEKDITHPDLGRFAFRWQMPGVDTKAIVLGFGSLYNHSEKPKATYYCAFFDRAMHFVALEDIGKDEEITINYGYKINEKDIRP